MATPTKKDISPSPEAQSSSAPVSDSTISIDKKDSDQSTSKKDSGQKLAADVEEEEQPRSTGSGDSVRASEKTSEHASRIESEWRDEIASQQSKDVTGQEARPVSSEADRERNDEHDEEQTLKEYHDHTDRSTTSRDAAVDQVYRSTDFSAIDTTADQANRATDQSLTTTNLSVSKEMPPHRDHEHDQDKNADTEAYPKERSTAPSKAVFYERQRNDMSPKVEEAANEQDDYYDEEIHVDKTRSRSTAPVTKVEYEESAKPEEARSSFTSRASPAVEIEPGRDSRKEADDEQPAVLVPCVGEEYDLMLKDIVDSLGLLMNHYVLMVCHQCENMAMFANDKGLYHLPPGKEVHIQSLYAPLTGKDVVILIGDLFHETDLNHIKHVIVSLDQVSISPPIMVLFMHPKKLKSVPGSHQKVLSITNSLLQLGADNVLWVQLAHDVPGPSLYYHVEISRIRIQNNMLRMSQLMQAHQTSSVVDLDYVEKLEQKYYDVLWNYLPKRVMVHFPVCDRALSETATGSGIGNYHYETMMKEGRFGTIYQGYDKTDPKKEEVCIKIVNKWRIQFISEMESAYREYRILAFTITHPNVAKYKKLLHAAHQLFRIYEYVGQRTLGHLIQEQEQGALSPADARSLTTQLVAGVSHLQFKGITHRNLNHDHVMVMKPLTLKIIGFNACASTKPNQRLSTPYGKFPYAAPEMLDPAMNYCGHKVDSWSIGALVTEMIAGFGKLEKELGFKGCNIEPKAESLGLDGTATNTANSAAETARRLTSMRNLFSQPSVLSKRLLNKTTCREERDRIDFYTFIDMTLRIDEKKRKTPLELKKHAMFPEGCFPEIISPPKKKRQKKGVVVEEEKNVEVSTYVLPHRLGLKSRIPGVEGSDACSDSGSP